MEWGLLQTKLKVCLTLLPLLSASAHGSLLFRGHLDYPATISLADRYPEELAIYSGMKGFDRSGYDLILHLHGYRVVRDELGRLETFDDVLEEFDFDSLLLASGRKAVVVIPSSLGKCDTYASHLVPEQRLNYFLTALFKKLGAYPNRLVLIGHSGAYHTLASLTQSFIQDFISELYLLDGDYGEKDAFLRYLRNPKHRFISVYRKGSSTDDGSYQLWRALYQTSDSQVLSREAFYRASFSPEVSPTDLLRTGASFITTSGDHWRVVNDFWSRLIHPTGSVPIRE